MNNKEIALPHDRSDFFTTPQYKIAVIDFFLAELMHDGIDITSLLFISPTKKSTATIFAKQDGILAGQEEIQFFTNTKECFLDIRFNWKKKDQDHIKIGDVICEISGNTIDILNIERVALNMLSRMSGIATTTKKILEKSKTPIAGTRKTQWSYLDKKAIFVGGGNTHRMGLFDAVLVKENHLIAGNKQDILKKLLNIQKYESKEIIENIKFIEFEVENTQEFYEVLQAFLDKKFDTKNQYQYVIMLDNFSPQHISDLFLELENKKLNKIMRNKNNIFIEISGGITEKNIEHYSNLGADVISLGSLTHSVTPIDFSLRF